MSDISQAERPEGPTESQVAELKNKAPLLSGGGIGAIIPQDIDQVWRLATILVQAEMAPKSLNTPAKATVAIMHGMEVGLMPMQSMQSIAVINNMPSIYGDAMLALVIASPVYGDHVESIEFDDQGVPWQATCSAVRKGDSRWRTQTVTRAQAQKAGWWSKAGPWSSTPHRMLQMRARGWCLRDTFPDVLRGLVSAEEAADIVDITDKGSATTAPEPKRTDFTKPGPHRASKPGPASKVTDVAHDTETGELDQATAKKSWKLADSIAGQQAKLSAIHDLLGMAEIKSEVDDIEAEHKEFLDKLGRNKAETLKAFADRKAELPEKVAE